MAMKTDMLKQEKSKLAYEKCCRIVALLLSGNIEIEKQQKSSLTDLLALSHPSLIEEG